MIRGVGGWDGGGGDGLEDVGDDALGVLEPDGGGVALHLHRED